MANSSAKWHIGRKKCELTMSTDWDGMFAGVQTIVRDAASIRDGIAMAIEFAKKKPEEYGDLAEWDRVTTALDEFPIDRIVQWAEMGIEQLDHGSGTEVLLLDLGDCPHMFEIQRVGDSKTFDDEELRQTVRSQVIIGDDDLRDATRESHGNFKMKTLITRNLIYERFGLPTSRDNASASYFFWLAAGSLAFLEPFRNSVMCVPKLKGRRKLYLLSGFEEIFLYLCTVTEKGIAFSTRKTGR